MGPVLAIIAPHNESHLDPNYAVGWIHFTPENHLWQLYDGVFWIAVKGEIDLQGIMPDCEPFAMDIPTGPEGADELWTVLSAPPDRFWHKTMQFPYQFNVLKAKVTGREICVKNVIINSTRDVWYDIYYSSEMPFSELPPMHPPDVVADDRVMTWNDCAAATWDDPVNLGLSLEDLDDGRTRTITINDMERVVLTPTLVKVLKSSGAGAIRVGLITPRMRDMLEFATV